MLGGGGGEVYGGVRGCVGLSLGWRGIVRGEGVEGGCGGRGGEG